MTEELEGVKAAMDEKGTSMTDAGPLVRIKQSLMRLKAESTQMEVRIGVVRGGGGGRRRELEYLSSLLLRMCGAHALLWFMTDLLSVLLSAG